MTLDVYIHYKHTLFMSYHCFTRLLCLQSCFIHPISSVFSPGCRLMWAAFSVGTVDAISLWNSKHRCNQPGGKQSSQITPGSSAVESSTGIAAFPLLMTAAKHQLLQQHQNSCRGGCSARTCRLTNMTNIGGLYEHADLLLRWSSLVCIGLD